MTIKCLVPCRDSQGTPCLHPVVVTCSASAYQNGDHYDVAAEVAEEAGYEVPVGTYGSRLVIDEHDGPAPLFALYFGG